MFQTITVDGGRIQLTYTADKESIRAYCQNGLLLGTHFRTVLGATRAIKRAHKRQVNLAREIESFTKEKNHA